MDYKLILVYILGNSFVYAFPSTDKKSDIDQSKEDNIGHEYKNTFLDKEIGTNLITDRPASTYEVTEIVIDIPDNRTKGPIITNYTISRPLNTVLTTDTDSENVTQSEIKEQIGNVTLPIDRDKEGKKNCISIFHVKAEFEDKTEHTIQGLDSHQVPQMTGIREYFNSIKRGIVNGFTSIINKHKKDDDDNDDSNGPLGFITKLHKKSTDAAHKFHCALFGHSDHKHY